MKKLCKKMLKNLLNEKRISRTTYRLAKYILKALNYSSPKPFPTHFLNRKFEAKIINGDRIITSPRILATDPIGLLSWGSDKEFAEIIEKVIACLRALKFSEAETYRIIELNLNDDLKPKSRRAEKSRPFTARSRTLSPKRG